MRGRARMLAVLSAAALSTVGQLEAAELGGTFEARLVKYGRMPPSEASNVANLLTGFLTGPAGPGDTDPLDTIQTAYEGLPAAQLVGQCVIAFGRDVANGGRSEVGLRVQDCDAIAAAILRKPAREPWRPLDGGDWLYPEMVAAGVPDAQAKKAATSMGNVVAYLPFMVAKRMPGPSALFTTCPASKAADTAARLRAWHAGVTRDMALCIAGVVRRLGPAEANRVIFIDEDVGAAWIRWASVPPGVSLKP